MHFNFAFFRNLAALVLMYPLIVACASNGPQIGKMPTEEMQNLANFIHIHGSDEELPTGWRELSGEEIRALVSGTNFKAQNIAKNGSSLHYNLTEDGKLVMGQGLYQARKGNWETTEHALVATAAGHTLNWFFLTDDEAIVMLRFYQGRRFFYIYDEASAIVFRS